MIDKTSGIILINKPKDWTSHDIVNKLRKITGIKKIGHTGTLDPFSTGLLILLVGKEATKKQAFFLHQNKTYWGKAKLGVISDTYDSTGQIKEQKLEKIPDFDIIKELEGDFIGEQFQKPPIFSAKKIKGQKAYQLARQGKQVKIEPQRIHIYSFKILTYCWPYIEFQTEVSSGTYIRSLAYDIGQHLKTGALLEELKREKIGKFSLSQAVEINQLNQENWQNYIISLNPVRSFN